MVFCRDRECSRQGIAKNPHQTFAYPATSKTTFAASGRYVPGARASQTPSHPFRDGLVEVANDIRLGTPARLSPLNSSNSFASQPRPPRHSSRPRPCRNPHRPLPLGNFNRPARLRSATGMGSSVPDTGQACCGGEGVS